MKCYNCGERELILLLLWPTKTILVKSKESIEDPDFDVDKAPVVDQHPPPVLYCGNCGHNQ